MDSEMEGANSLLGHDSELASERWKEDTPTYYFFQRSRRRILTFLITFLSILLTLLVIFYLKWHVALEIPGSEMNGHFESTIAPGPERDLKVLLHPEDHVSRDPSTRHFSWNITKAIITPNGVQKNVFLINGTADSNHALYFMSRMLTMVGQYPGPTVEARSGDILEIEVFNFSDEEISLHWHGLHMRGI
jgi:FtsP/CotA-like multicopper oxidase with cupredoxin domain